jgi:hypothetical protein
MKTLRNVLAETSHLLEKLSRQSAVSKETRRRLRAAQQALEWELHHTTTSLREWELTETHARSFDDDSGPLVY